MRLRRSLRRWGLLAGAVLVLSSCSYASPASWMLTVLLGLLAAGCGTRPIAATGEPDPPARDCGQGSCPVGMTCVDRASQDWCVPDADGDGVPDDQDNCRFVSNPDQADTGGRPHLGDACDLCTVSDPAPLSPCCDPCTDSDGDGVADMGSPAAGGRDNCPFVANADQSDRDGDGIGDACDLAPDSPSTLSPCANADLDSDGDGRADSCPPPEDTCPTTASDHVGDADGDGVGDVCDPDGIPPIISALPTAQRRRALLERLAHSGVLDQTTVEIALGSLSLAA